MSISLWLPKLYANAMIMVINARFKIVSGDQVNEHIIQTFPTTIRFKDVTSTSAESSVGRTSLEAATETRTVGV